MTATAWQVLVGLAVAMLTVYAVLLVALLRARPEGLSLPDVVPVLGYADDVLVTLLVLRAVVRRVRASSLERHWPGSPEGLLAVLTLAGCGDEGAVTPRWRRRPPIRRWRQPCRRPR